MTTYMLVITLMVTRVFAQEQGLCGQGMIQLFNGVSCQNDQTCQRMSTGFFCYMGHCCSSVITMSSGYGSSCTANNQCLYANSQCVGNVCYCQTGYGYNGKQCQMQGLFRDDNTILTTCPQNEVSVNGICYPMRSYYGACEFSNQCAYPGAVCDNNQCKCLYGQIFNGQQCVQDLALPKPTNCPVGQVLIGGICYPLMGLGESCTQDQQCRPGGILDAGISCRNGICQRTTNSPERAVQCRNSLAQVEMIGASPKNCISYSCSSGYHCEYNTDILQYICCGPQNGITGLGQVKMYPGYSNLPLQCFGVNSCTFVDYPYCVYSQSYRHNVCCSKHDCI